MATTASADTKTKTLYLEMLRKMLRIRKFEEMVITLAGRGELRGAHLYIGEEAVAVGACSALNDTDYVTGNHRSHGHPIAKGADVRRAMAELYGKKTGYCKGKGGSMHLADFSVGILGESGILASGVPVACGAGLASKLRGDGRVAVSFFGDGASNEGACHESMNLASVWKLPVIFVCENNQYAMTTNWRTTVAVENIADRAAAYNMPGVLVDGQDVVAMHEAMREAVARARAGHGPSLIEARTYRYRDHSEGFNRLLRAPYRPEEEMAYWLGRDPIKLHQERILGEEVASQAEIDAIEAEVVKLIDEAVDFARSSPYPDPDDVWEDMYTNSILIER